MNPFPSRGQAVSEHRRVAAVVLAILLFPCVGGAQIVTGPFGIGTLAGIGVTLARAMSASGQVVGDSTTNTGARHAFSWTPTGGMINLGALWPGATSSSATAVNANGQVVGVVSVGGGPLQGFSWTAAGGMTDLGGLPGGQMIPTSVNSAGRVVGSSLVISDPPSGLAERHAVSWTAEGGIISLGGSALVDTFAVEVNDHDFIVGYSEDRACCPRVQQALAWMPSALGDIRIELGTLGGRGSIARHVNAIGQVIGDSYVANESDLHAFSWTLASGMVDLGTLGGGFSQAFGLNDQGQIVGWSSTSDVTQHAFSWTAAGGMIDLGTLGGSSYANAVNANGQVVGRSFLPGSSYYHGFWWPGSGSMIDLGAFETTLGGNFSSAEFISDAGQIGGFSTVPLSFVLRPPLAVVWQVHAEPPPPEIIDPVQAVSDLIAAVAGSALQQKSHLLENARDSLNRNNTGAACHQMGAFINHVEAQSDKDLTAAEADSFVRAAENIRMSLVCPSTP